MLTNKYALVTGSSRGIGLGIAEKIIQQGGRVTFNSRSKSDIAALQDKHPDQYFFCGDMTSVEDCTKLAQFVENDLKKLDVLVLNVGSGRSVPAGEETQDEWLRVLKLNLLSATTPIEKLKKIILRDKTSIVMISSICGVESLCGTLTYSAAKAALNSYAKGLARAWATHGVRVNVVAPGNIIFPGSSWETKIQNDKAAADEMLNKNVPMNRFGTPEEVADAVTFLASERASFMTGSILVADGGQTKGL